MISNLEHVSPLGKSDHCVLNFDFNCYANICSQPKILKMYNGNYRDFIQEIKNIKWQDKLNETNNNKHRYKLDNLLNHYKGP